MHRSFIALLFIAAPALAQSVLIERIEVVSTHVRPAIVRAETRLAAGHAYTAAQLDQAVYRVRRLPFVADATYSLEPGSTPEARVLRLSVIDEPVFNYDFDVQAVAMRGGYATSTTGLGLRFFPVTAGALEFNAGGSEFSTGGGTGSGHFGDLAAQYTQYALFGTSAYAGVGISSHYNAKDRLISPMGLVGIPLTQRQTLRASYARSGDKTESNSILLAEWLYQTIDDPFFARRGVDLAAGPQWQKFHAVYDFNVGTPHFFHVEYRNDYNGVVGSAAKYWPVADHSTLWARLAGQYITESGTTNGVKNVDSHDQIGDLTVGAAHNFDHWRDSDAFHRLRAEIGVGYHRDRSSTVFHATDRSGAEVFTGVAYRSRYGVIHIGLSYVSTNN